MTREPTRELGKARRRPRAEATPEQRNAPGAIVAIDLGTTEAKAGLVDLRGRFLASASARYPLVHGPAPGQVEQDPEAWWSAVASAVRELRAPDCGLPLRAVCCVGQAPTLVATGDDGTPVRPAIGWMDVRSAMERRDLEDASGLRGWALGNLPSALWIERNEPKAAGRVRAYLESWEWIALRMSGRAARTRFEGQASPDDTAVGAAGLPPSRLPGVVAAGSVLGGLTPQSAADLGLPPRLPVVGGLNDGHSSFLGAGLREPGDAIDTGGTSGGFGVYVDRDVDVPGAWTTRAAVPDRWIVGGAMAATGKALEWFRDEVLGGALTIEALIDEAAATPPGAAGLVFLPYLAGERSPIWDTRARGAFAGLTVGHGRGHLTRAILEAAALAIRHVAAPIVAAGFPVGEMRVSGGPARSREWNRIKADVTGFTVAVPAVLETALIGAAILAAVASGDYADTGEAMAGMVTVAELIEPRAELSPTYDALFAAYTGLHPRLRAVLT